MTLGFGVKSYVGYRIRQRKQREVAKENEFYMQLLQLALPNEDPVQDELIMSQMSQSTEVLHSDELGEIVLPLPSPIVAQQVQQQQLLLASTASVKSMTTNGSGSSNSNSNSSLATNAPNAKQVLNNSNISIFPNKSLNLSSTIGNGHTVNGMSPNGPSLSASVMTNGATSMNHMHSQHQHHASSNLNTSISSNVTLRARHRNSLDRSDRNGDNTSATRSMNGSSGNNTSKGDTGRDGQHAKRSTYHGSVLRDAGKITESISTSIWSTIRCRLWGGGTNRDSNAGGAVTSSATTSSSSAKRKDDDDTENVSNDTESNHSVASMYNAGTTSNTRLTDGSGSRGNKDLRNSSATDVNASPNTLTSSSTVKHERDSSKTSNNNYSADVSSEGHYHHNHHMSNSKEKHFNKVHQQNGSAAIEMELNIHTTQQPQQDNTGESFEKGRGKQHDTLIEYI